MPANEKSTTSNENANNGWFLDKPDKSSILSWYLLFFLNKIPYFLIIIYGYLILRSLKKRIFDLPYEFHSLHIEYTKVIT